MNEQAFVQRYSTTDKLLLAQAVHKLGAAQWEGISKLLQEHPCISDRTPSELEDLFSAKACEEAYVGLMTDIGVNVPAEGGIKPNAKPHLRLAQTHYIARMAELKETISNYESRFSTLMSEVQMLKAGEMDGAIVVELRAVLARKFGKKLLDAWMPEKVDIVDAVQKGSVTDEERDAAEAKERDAAKRAEDEKRAEEAEGEAEKEKERVEMVDKETEGEEADADLAPETAEAEDVEAEKEEEDIAPVEDMSIVQEEPEFMPESTETKVDEPEPPVPAEPLLPPRRKAGGRSQKAVSTEKEVEKPVEAEAAEDSTEVEEDKTVPIVQAQAEEESKPLEGRRRGKKPSTAIIPTAVPVESPAIIEESIQAGPSNPTRSAVERTPSVPARSTRKGKTPAPEPTEDIEMADDNNSTPIVEILSSTTTDVPKGPPPRAESRRNPKSETTPAPPTRTASNAKRITTPARTPLPDPTAESPMGSPLSDLSDDTPPAEKVPKGRSSKKAAPKRNSKGKKEAEVEVEPEVEVEQETEEVEVEEVEAAGPSKRGGNKRKAGVPPTGAPAGKRKGGRRATSPVPTIATIPDSDVEEGEEEGKVEEEAEGVATGGSRRGAKGSMPAPLLSAAATRRGRATKESPGLSARTRGSSPAASRRAPSVSSATSAATPSAAAGSKRGAGGRPARGKAATKDDEEAEDTEMAEEEEEKPTRGRGRSTRGGDVDVVLSTAGGSEKPARGKGASHVKKAKPSETEKEDAGETETTDKRSKRASMRGTLAPARGMHDQDDEPSPSAHSVASASVSPRKERERVGDSAGGGGGSGVSRPSLGRNRASNLSPGTRDKKMTTKLLLGLWDQVSSHKNGNIFQNPVKKSDAPDYFDVVKHPMDLKTIRLKIRDGQISNVDEFERDLHLVFANAMMYNEEGNQIYVMAEDMLKDAEGHLAHFRAMQQDLGR